MATRQRTREYWAEYTRDLRTTDFQNLFTRDTPEAYRYFVRGLDVGKLVTGPWYRRWWMHTKIAFHAFTRRLTPARRLLYAFGVGATLIGMINLFQGVGASMSVGSARIWVPTPHWAPGAFWMLLGFAAVNLLMLMEVADRLSLKGELEIARDIQLAMLPSGAQRAGDTIIAGVTRPANTVGGDLYDIQPLPDGRMMIALGDVAGKGSPAALLMALLVAMLRTLVDEGLDAASLVARLNVQVARHSPASRFITLFFGIYDPQTGQLEFVNAGHLPPLLRRVDGTIDRIETPDAGGIALGMFDEARYTSQTMTIERGEIFVLYSDGITEAENTAGVPFEEPGLRAVIASDLTGEPAALGRTILTAVEMHAGDARLGDDLTALVLQRG